MSPTLDFQNNSLQIQYAAPFFEQENKMEYQTWLEGFDKHWSAWSRRTEKEYTNLPEGEYTFHARAKNIYEHFSSEATFKFTVLPPWYRTFWAYLFYFLAACGLVFGLVRLRTQQLRERQVELEKTVEERTHEIQQKVEELAIINSVGSGLAKQLEFQAIVNLVGDKIREIFKSPTIYIALYDKETGLFRLPYYLEQGKKINVEPQAFGSGLTSHVIKSRAPLLITEDAERRFAELGAIPSSENEVAKKSWLGVPIIMGDSVTGVISLQDIKEHAYSETDVRLLSTLGSNMGVALENARLFDETTRLLSETEQRAEELGVINSVQEGLVAKLEMQAIYDLIGDKIRDIFDAQVVGIATFDRESGNEIGQYLFEKGERFYPEPRPLDKLRQQLIRTGEIVVIKKHAEVIKAKYDMKVIPGTESPKSSVFVPMVVGDTVKGYVTLQNIDRENAFSDADVRLLSTLTNSMSVTLENARLFDETNRLLAETEKAKKNIELLSEIGKNITATLSIEQIIDTVYENVNNLMDASVFGIGIYDEETQRIDMPATKEKGQTLAPFYYSLSDENRPAVWCFKQQTEIFFNDYTTEFQEYFEALPEAAAGDNPESMLYLPLTHQENQIGVITAQSFKKNAYTKYHLNILRNLATYAAIALENADAYRQLNTTVENLKATQTQLVAQEKLASLGQLTAGIAHEIKNPLNFVNNFAQLSIKFTNAIVEDLRKLKGKLSDDEIALLESNLGKLEQLSEKINEHGKRADSIVKSMMSHARKGTSERMPTDINALLDESANLVYHGMRARQTGFNITIEKDYDETVGKIEAVSQDISRVFLNIIGNACYAADEKARGNGQSEPPTLWLRTRNLGSQVEIRIRDNGNGISEEAREKIFTPFFTTKPTGEGTGLGLSISYDTIVKGHGGVLRVESKEGEFAEFVIRLPK